MRLRQLYTDNRCQPFPHIISRKLLFDVFCHWGIAEVRIDTPGQSGFKACQMAPPLLGIDIVGKGEKIFLIGIIVLKGDINQYTAFLSRNNDGFSMEQLLVSVEIFYKRLNPPFV